MGKEDFALKAQGWGAIIPIVVYNCPHKPKGKNKLKITGKHYENQSYH